MKLETKRKIRRWVCRRLGIEETVEIPVVKTIHPPVETLGAQGCFNKWKPGTDAERYAENVLKRQLAYQLAEALLEDDRSLITIEDAENDRMLRVMTVKVRVVPWKE
ncbi:MAG: hypothetical protein IKU94_01430 [Bacteroidaceae bacterium]|nr:hypothetical protein [Bacteroidaceae bacterium]